MKSFLILKREGVRSLTEAHFDCPFIVTVMVTHTVLMKQLAVHVLGVVTQHRIEEN